MEYICGERPLLGALLAQQGEVTSDEVEQALEAQTASGEPLGEILLEAGAVCRPMLDRALAKQSGLELHFERGYGTGLRSAIESRHRMRRGLQPGPAAA
jgi:hypothetical protein